MSSTVSLSRTAKLFFSIVTYGRKKKFKGLSKLICVSKNASCCHLDDVLGSRQLSLYQRLPKFIVELFLWISVRRLCRTCFFLPFPLRNSSDFDPTPAVVPTSGIKCFWRATLTDRTNLPGSRGNIDLSALN